MGCILKFDRANFKVRKKSLLLSVSGGIIKIVNGIIKGGRYEEVSSVGVGSGGSGDVRDAGTCGLRHMRKTMREAVQYMPAEDLRDMRTAVQRITVDGRCDQLHESSGHLPEVQQMREAVQHVPEALQHLQQVKPSL